VTEPATTERPVALREDVSYAHLDGAGLPLVGARSWARVVIVGKVTIVRGAGQTRLRWTPASWLT
jgi:DNA-directed RNA polymerase beta subunit